MRTGKVVMLGAGSLLTLIGIVSAVAGAILGVAYINEQKHGYITSPAATYQTSTAALVSSRIDLVVESGIPDQFRPENAGRIRLRAEPTTPNQTIFIGVAPAEKVAAYLSGVGHTQLTSVQFNAFIPNYRDVPGDAIAVPPSTQSFWVESANGSGAQELTWRPQAGNRVVVVMNAEATPGVSTQLSAGLHFNYLGPLTLTVVGITVALLVVGVTLVYLGARGSAHRKSGPAHGTSSDDRSEVAGVGANLPAGSDSVRRPPDSPLHIRGDLDASVSRGMWLIKWLTILPHAIVLVVLCTAAFFMSIVAGVAILITGRYPRRVFDFNVGVLRWVWRVSFYAYSSLGTDRYPPFTLRQVDYPADLEVDYPEHLSRGLVLVKWWLLAIPHYVILALFIGAPVSGWGDQFVTGTGNDVLTQTRVWPLESLLGVLVFIAAVVLLVTGRYPRSLFDFIMGINRWLYRVLVYVVLMTDQHPPMRFDQGPRERRSSL